MNETKKQLKEHDEQLDTIARTVAEHTEQLDVITRTVTDHTERLNRIENKLEGMATKNDLNEITKTLDRLVVLAEKKDQELTILGQQVKKVTDRVETLEKDFKQIKPALGLS